MRTDEFVAYIAEKLKPLNLEERLNKVYDIFVEKFGEERVELIRGEMPAWDTIYTKLFNSCPGDASTYFHTENYESPVVQLLRQKWYERFINWEQGDLDMLPIEFWEGVVVNAYHRANEYSYYRGSCIVVHFPIVTIVNEFGSNTTVKDLYMKTWITDIGTYTGELVGMRTTFTRKQIASRYIHSHIHKLSYDDPESFNHFCTGHGPINSVMTNLCHGFDEMDWQVYCYELNRLVSVESVAGTPYIRMDEMNNKNASQIYMDKFSFNDYGMCYVEFLKYFLKNKTIDIKFNFLDGHYDLNVNFAKFVLDISKCYKEFTRKADAKSLALTSTHRFTSVLMINNKFYLKDGISRERVDRFIEDYNGTSVLTFKGKSVPLVVEDAGEVVDNEVSVVSRGLINGIYTDLVILANNGEIIRKSLASNEQETRII